MDLTQCLGMAGAVNSADALDNSVILVNPEDCERPEVNFKQVTAWRVVTSVFTGIKKMQI